PAYPSNPVSGAVSGGQAGAAQGSATGGPVGAIVGGALGTATGTVAGTANAVTGTANALTGAPASTMCGPGFVYSNGHGDPAREAERARIGASPSLPAPSVEPLTEPPVLAGGFG